MLSSSKDCNLRNTFRGNTTTLIYLKKDLTSSQKSSYSLLSMELVISATAYLAYECYKCYRR